MELGLGSLPGRLALLFSSILHISPKSMSSICQTPEAMSQKLHQESRVKLQMKFNVVGKETQCNRSEVGQTWIGGLGGCFI